MKDSPTTVVLNAGLATTDSILVACGIFDADGSDGTCSITRATGGQPLMEWRIGENRVVNFLTPGERYVLTLKGYANKKRLSGTLDPVGVNMFVPFETEAGGIVCPPGYILLPNGDCTIDD